MWLWIVSPLVATRNAKGTQSKVDKSGFFTANHEVPPEFRVYEVPSGRDLACAAGRSLERYCSHGMGRRLPSPPGVIHGGWSGSPSADETSSQGRHHHGPRGGRGSGGCAGSRLLASWRIRCLGLWIGGVGHSRAPHQYRGYHGVGKSGGSDLATITGKCHPTFHHGEESHGLDRLGGCHYSHLTDASGH